MQVSLVALTTIIAVLIASDSARAQSIGPCAGYTINFTNMPSNEWFALEIANLDSAVGGNGDFFAWNNNVNVGNNPASFTQLGAASPQSISKIRVYDGTQFQNVNADGQVHLMRITTSSGSYCIEVKIEPGSGPSAPCPIVIKITRVVPPC
jgi:hypothetical protein